MSLVSKGMWDVLWRREYRGLSGKPEGNDHEEDLGVRVTMFYTYRCEQSPLPTRLLTPIHVEHTITTYTTVSLTMNPRGSKHVGDNRNSN
jgi:hypothetical protein